MPATPRKRGLALVAAAAGLGLVASPLALTSGAIAADSSNASDATHSHAAKAQKKKKVDYDADKGTPLYDQDSRRWGRRKLGNRHHTIASAGCALTATAMAISRISGKRINPGQLDRYCDRHGGYWGNNLVWERAAKARGLTAGRPRFRLKTIDKNLKRNRPVVIGVSFKKGGAGGANGTDH